MGHMYSLEVRGLAEFSRPVSSCRAMAGFELSLSLSVSTKKGKLGETVYYEKGLFLYLSVHTKVIRRVRGSSRSSRLYPTERAAKEGGREKKGFIKYL